MTGSTAVARYTKVGKCKIFKMQIFFGVLFYPAPKNPQKEDLNFFFDNQIFFMQIFFRVGYNLLYSEWKSAL